MIYFTDSARSARSWNLALISVKSTTSNKGQYLLAAEQLNEVLRIPVIDYLLVFVIAGLVALIYRRVRKG
jgi:hypothetical protein